MRRITHWSIAVLCGLACLSVIAFIVVLLRDTNEQLGAVLLILIVFGGIAAFFAWLAVRAWRERYVNRSIVNTHQLVDAFQQEIARSINPKKLPLSIETGAKFQELVIEGKLEEVGALLESIKDHVDPLWLQLAKASWLGECRRHLEAADHFDSLARAVEWTDSSKTVLLGWELMERVLAGQVAEVNRRCEELVAGKSSTEEKVLVLDQLASLPVYRGLTTYIDDADRRSSVALSLAPDFLTVLGTRGAILVEKGRFEEALPLLKSVLRRSPAPLDHFTSYFYMGLIAKHRGDSKAMKKYAMWAWNYCTMPSFRERIAHELVDFSPRKNAQS